MKATKAKSKGNHGSDCIVRNSAVSVDLYAKLQLAYDFFNKELFGGQLPPCFLTVQRENDNVHGYFSTKRFGSKVGTDKLDEIAMNPIYFINDNITNALSTLVHEMVHLEQDHFGNPGRGRYHNIQWGEWMERIGLMPSNTGTVREIFY
jgi:hypothetical protein